MKETPIFDLRRWLLVLMAAMSAGVALAAEPPVLDLQVTLDPSARALAVQAELRPAEAPFRFVLHESLRPRTASADGRPLTPKRVAQRDGLQMWELDVRAGELLRLDYAGTLPALEHGRDHRAVLQAMPPMASARGSYLSSGSAWYPRPADLFSYSVRITVTGGQRALVAGRLAEETLPTAADEAYRAHFVFDQPTDGIDLMAGPWTVRERVVSQADGRPLRLRTYFPPALDGEPALADAYLADSQRYIERYAAQIGAYPFTEFSVVASPLPTGFGMPTLTYIGEQVLRLPFIRATSLGHEVLHNWWGNGVMVDYARGNWSEGLTTFMADYAYKLETSAVGAREMRLGWLRDFAALPPDAHLPLAAFRSRTHGAAAAVGYGKAAMLFVMLEDEIGEEAFARGIRDFWARQRFRVAGWDDLRAAFEGASGRSLAGFFEQWLQIPGGPAPRIERAWLARGGDAEGERAADAAKLRLVLTQPQPAHALRVPLRLEAGSRTETHVVELAGERSEIEIDAAFVPEALRLDPELRVWRRPDADQLPPILRQWVVADAPRLVVADAIAWDERAGEAGDEMTQAAQALAVRLFERAPEWSGAGALREGGGPVLLVGSGAAVGKVLAEAGIPARPQALPAEGSAQVWTVQRAAGPPLAVVSAVDAAAVRALLRPLPHYGSQSWLVFDGAQAMARGVWEAPGRAVRIER